MFKISFLSCKNPFFVKIFRNPSDLTDCCSTELYKILPTISFEAYLVYFKNKRIRCFHYLDRRVVTRSILLPRQQNYPNRSTAAAVELSKPFYCHGSRIAETVLLPRQQNFQSGSRMKNGSRKVIDEWNMTVYHSLTRLGRQYQPGPLVYLVISI